MRISDWSSDVCSSDLNVGFGKFPILRNIETSRVSVDQAVGDVLDLRARPRSPLLIALDVDEDESLLLAIKNPSGRSEEHTSELQSLMRISYAVFCLKTKRCHLR